MIALVCGGRHYTDGSFLFEVMDRLHAEYHFTKVVEGGQRTRDKSTRKPIGGADFFAHDWAVLRGIEVFTERAAWGELGHPDAKIRRNRRGELYDANAGFRRNGVMLAKYRPDICVGFHPSGNGTADMLARSRAAGLKVLEFRAP